MKTIKGAMGAFKEMEDRKAAEKKKKRESQLDVGVALISIATALFVIFMLLSHTL